MTLGRLLIQLHTLTIGTENFPLQLGLNLRRFQKHVMRVSRHGGGILEIPTDGDDRITALVTRGVPMTFRSREIPDDEHHRHPHDVQAHEAFQYV